MTESINTQLLRSCRLIDFTHDDINRRLQSVALISELGTRYSLTRSEHTHKTPRYDQITDLKLRIARTSLSELTPRGAVNGAVSWLGETACLRGLDKNNITVHQSELRPGECIKFDDLESKPILAAFSEYHIDNMPSLNNLVIRNSRKRITTVPVTEVSGLWHKVIVQEF